jgi:hypothetical protein
VRGDRRIAGGEHQVLKAAQDEASPAVLRRKTPEALDLLLAEREGLHWRYLPETHDAGSAHPCDGRTEAVAAAGELTKAPKTKLIAACGLGPSLTPNSKHLVSNAPLRHVVTCGVSGRGSEPQQGLFGHLRRALFNRERFSVIEVRRAEGRLSVTTSQSFGASPLTPCHRLKLRQCLSTELRILSPAFSLLKP